MKIDIVLMASGDSKRFGCENKLLYKINDKPLFCYALENAIELKNRSADIIDNIIVVSKYEEIKKICSKYENIKYIYNSKSHRGISASIHLGVDNSLKNNGIMFMVCDQPFMKAETLYALTQGFMKSGKALGCLISSEGVTSNPCIFSPKWKKELSLIEGDKGGKYIINKNKDDVYFFCCDKNEEFRDIDKSPLFDFIYEKGHIVSIVGAGGKTTLMYKLAETASKAGMRTLITTTTHIYRPKKYALAENEQELISIWSKGDIAVVGRSASDGKLTMTDKSKLNSFMALADIVFIEADGAKGFPCKAPNNNEPVIIDKSDIVIGVAGADALGKPLNKVCFRKEKAAQLLGVEEEHIMTAYDIAYILSSADGTMKNTENRKYYALINKCDSAALIAKGKKIKKLLENRNIKAIVCSLKEDIYEQ